MKADLMDLPLFKVWLEDKKDLAKSSVTIYTEAIGKFLVTDPEIDQIEPYNDFLIKLTIKKRSSYYFYALKLFIEYKFTGDAKHKLIDNLVKPKVWTTVKQERKYLTEDQVMTIINNLQRTKHKIISIIQTMTGVRAGDIMRLKRGNIVPELYNGKNVLKITITGKGDKRNVVYIHDETIQDIVLNYVLNNTDSFGDYYFIELGAMNNRAGNVNDEFRMYRMNYLWYWQDLKTSLNKSGFDPNTFSTHDYRRCFARRAWEKWKDVQVLQNLLNHGDVRNTMRYLQQSGLKNIDYLHEMQK